jgi:hypothetical protein
MKSINDAEATEAIRPTVNNEVALMATETATDATNRMDASRECFWMVIGSDTWPVADSVFMAMSMEEL